MNQHSDIDRILQTWMADGPTAIPDRVIDVVAVRIGVQHQRRTWPFQRRTNVTTPIKLVASLAAALVVAVVGYNLLPRQPDTGASTPRPSPSATATATAPAATAPAASAPIPLSEGLLKAGRYRFQPLTTIPSVSIVADIPSGWSGVPPWALIGPTTEEPPSGLAIGILAADGLFSDPCNWDVDGTGAITQPGDVVVGPTVDDLVAALRANAAYTSIDPPIPVTFGEVKGQELEIQLPATDDNFLTCDKEQGDPNGRYFVFSGADAGLYAQGSNNRWRLFIVDAGGHRLIITILSYAGTPPTDLDAAQAIIESLEITP
jgi:hypothetical protein